MSNPTDAADFPTDGRRVTLINSYRMKEARRLISMDVYPAQHLWGLWDLSDAWAISVTNLCLNRLGEKNRLFRWITRNVERFAGDPIQVLWATSGINKGSIVYAANPKTGTLMGLLKRLKIIRVPYIVLVHSYPVSSWARWCLEPAEALLAFSDAIKEEMVADGFLSARVTVVGWGPDLSWSEYAFEPRQLAADFISAGKTNRDYSSLRDLAVGGTLNGRILDGRTATTYENGTTKTSSGRPSYPEVMRMMAESRVVLIPLEDPSMLSGLTEFSDAVALGKPVVMTRNSWMPLDIEALGIGVWLDENKPSAIHAAVLKACQIPSERVLEVARWFNMKTFSETLEDVLEKVWNDYRRTNNLG